MFSKILIANRGEIACRIIRTAKKQGIKTVAVYSDVDKKALHTRLADEAIYIGPAPALQSYLNIEAILHAAEKTATEAIHPGYGFLSENPRFVRACQEKNIIFIGPSSEAMEKMGDKGAAKRIMQQAGVPIIPGDCEPSREVNKLKKQAEELGFPVLLKACAGGGGKGMRAINDIADFEQNCLSAQREALKSFGDDTLIVEKYFPRAKHIEVQIFGDTQGNCVHLFERDCSMQRRYQKIIEEAAAPTLSNILREQLGAAAVAAAKAIQYVGAGTIEFLVSPDQQFYFMEMNTRLQVEHPVTECITGLDLVEWQLLVAQGEKLPLLQNEIKLSGHAIEVRLYAEDPENNFLPSIGEIRILEWPVEDASLIRIDTGVTQGDEISVYYDPMIAKIIAWGDTRKHTIQLLESALSQTKILGLTTNLAFLRNLINSSVFSSGAQYTTFIQESDENLVKTNSLTDEVIITIAASYYWNNLQIHKATNNPWTFSEGWRLNLPQQFLLLLRYCETNYLVTCQKKNETRWFITVGDTRRIVEILEMSDARLSIEIDFQKYDCLVQQDKANIYLAYQGQQGNVVLTHLQNDNKHILQNELAGLRSPMPGTVISVLIKKGDHVKMGDALILVEAMKMEHTIKAPAEGIVKEIFFNEGDAVTEGAELVVFEA